MRAPAPEAPTTPRHRRRSPDRGTGARWLPLVVAVAVAAVGVGVSVVDRVTVPPVSEPSLLALIPPTPDTPVLLAAPAGGDRGTSAAEGPAVTTPTTVETAAAEPDPEAEATAAPAPRRSAGTGPSGLPWRSGIWVGPPAEVAAWEAYRGRPVDVVHAFTDRGSWDTIESAAWILGYYADAPVALVISQPFWPEGSGGSLGECASGAYDDNWANYGRSLVEAGRTDAYTRLAWEFNGDWFEWSATDVESWKQCFRKVVHAVRTTAPDARFDWTMNAHGSQTSDGSAWNSYPGDDVVDVVGIDPYDHWPASRTAAEFDAQCADSEGLCNVIEFAREHGKGVGVTEWGVIGGGGGGGDNPLYMEKMFETFMDGADVLEYETYFNSADFGNSLINPNQNPESSDVYRKLWGR